MNDLVDDNYQLQYWAMISRLLLEFQDLNWVVNQLGGSDPPGVTANRGVSGSEYGILTPEWTGYREDSRVAYLLSLISS